MTEKKFNWTLGLPLSRKAMRVLKNAGIYAPPIVTVEHQHLARCYVVRGMEAGGAIQDLGRYITFVGPGGERIPYLHPVESIGVNGLHAVVIAPVLVRVDMLRKGRTYEVLVTEHEPGTSGKGSRPQMETKVLFRGVHGRIELDLWGKDKAQAGSILPTFYSLAGEPVPVPNKFAGVLKAASKAVSCLRCAHSHYLLRPKGAGAIAASTAPTLPAPDMPVTGSIAEVIEEAKVAS